MTTFYIFIVMMVTWVYTFIKTYEYSRASKLTSKEKGKKEKFSKPTKVRKWREKNK